LRVAVRIAELGIGQIGTTGELDCYRLFHLRKPGIWLFAYLSIWSETAHSIKRLTVASLFEEVKDGFALAAK